MRSRKRITKGIIKEFQRFGNLLWQRGLISYQAGNISLLDKDSIIIKRRGAPLGFLKEKDVIRAPLEGEDPSASSELPTHQAIYKKTDARAIIHCHPPHAVTLSLFMDEITPLDTESHLLIGKGIPVIKAPQGGKAIEEIAEVLKRNRIVIIKGHGTFSKGQTLEEAFSITTTLEYSCHIYWAWLVASSSHLR